MFSAETIPGSPYANIWAAGIESASKNAQQDAVSTTSATHNMWQMEIINRRHDPTLHERRNQYINSSKRNKIKTLDRQNGQEE